MCLYVVLHCKPSPVSLFNENEIFIPSDMLHHLSINHGFCQWSIPQDMGSLIFKVQLCKDYNIRMRYGCVNFMAERTKIFFFVKWSFSSTEFYTLYLRHLSKLTHYDEAIVV